MTHARQQSTITKIKKWLITNQPTNQLFVSQTTTAAKILVFSESHRCCYTNSFFRLPGPIHYLSHWKYCKLSSSVCAAVRVHWCWFRKCVSFVGSCHVVRVMSFIRFTPFVRVTSFIRLTARPLPTIVTQSAPICSIAFAKNGDSIVCSVHSSRSCHVVCSFSPHQLSTPMTLSAVICSTAFAKIGYPLSCSIRFTDF